MTQGTPTEAFDFDTLFAARSLAPKPAKLMGVEFTVRRDLTPEEVIEYWRLMRQSQVLDATALLVGEQDAVRLDDVLSALPAEHIRTFMDRLQRIAGVLPRTTEDHLEASTERDSGESSAS